MFILYAAAIAILIAFGWGAMALYAAEKRYVEEYKRECADEDRYAE